MLFRTTHRGILSVKLLVLDCDGIIFNSNQLKTQAYRHTLSNIGCSTEEIAQFVHLHLSDVSVSRFVKFTSFFTDILHLPIEESKTKTEEALDGYSSACLQLYSELQPEQGALAFVDTWSRPAQTYVISGGAQTELNHVFEQHRIRHKFHQVLGSPTTKIEHLSRILEETKVSPDSVLFVGDGWTDYKTSKAIGCHFCFLKEMSDWTDNVKQMEGNEEMVTRCLAWKDVLARVVASSDTEGNGDGGELKEQETN